MGRGAQHGDVPSYHVCDISVVFQGQQQAVDVAAHSLF